MTLCVVCGESLPSIPIRVGIHTDVCSVPCADAWCDAMTYEEPA